MAKIERDLEEEENTIMELSAFWNNHVMARVEPPLVEKPDAVLESLRRYFGPADKSEPTVDLDRKFVVNLKEILTLKEEKRALDAQVKALETRIKSSMLPSSKRWVLRAKEPVNRAASVSKFPTTLCIGKEYRKIVYLLYELSILISMMSLWIRRNQESLRWSNRPSHKE